MDYDKLKQVISQVNWTAEFHDCITTDEYAQRLTNILQDETDKCSHISPLFQRPRIPKHIVKLLRAKKRACIKSKRTSKKLVFKEASKIARVALRQHRRCEEMRLIYAKDRKAFYLHIRRKSAGKRTGVNLCTNNTSLTEHESAETLLRTSSSNFFTASTAPGISSITDASLRFISSPTMIAEALHNCPNSDSSPDGLSFWLLKAIGLSILSPLNTVFQRSLSKGKFHVIWKEAIVLPLYKGKGKQNLPDNYRPISICHCIRKIIEKSVNTQLTKYVCDNQLLCNKQHGFTTGRSILTNLLTCDSTFANIMLAHQPYDILSFDFAKAFDKAPHSSIFTAVTNIGVGGQALG